MSMTGLLRYRVYREAIDHGLYLAIVECAAIAREEIVDRCTIFEVAFAHSLSPWSGLFGPSRWPSVRDVMLSHSGLTEAQFAAAYGDAGERPIAQVRQ